MLESVGAAALAFALVTTDAAVLRAGPSAGAQQQAELWQGELLEVRGERQDWLQVWDYRRERGGFVPAAQVRRTALAEAEAPELLAVLRFVREQPGAESLGIALAAAWLQAAPPAALRGTPGSEVFDALGSQAERLAQRASAGAALPARAQAAAAAHLEVAARFGVRFASYEQDGRMRICYDGDAFRRVLAQPATPLQQARAALALGDPDCLPPQLQPRERHAARLAQAQRLDAVPLQGLPPYVRNRVLLRRAGLWSTLAWERARFGEPPAAAAERALDALAGVQRSELAEADLAGYNDAVMQVNASRWAAMPPAAPQPLAARPAIVTESGAPGETCVLLVDARNDAGNPLARRCTYGQVWPQSATLNREGNALALAVQPLAGWRELWLFRRDGRRWRIDVLPPAPAAPGLGYAEFAGWVPGGRELLVAREARAEGRWRRSYEVIDLATLATRRQAGDAATLGPFQRWQDPAWRRQTVSLR